MTIHAGDRVGFLDAAHYRPRVFRGWMAHGARGAARLTTPPLPEFRIRPGAAWKTYRPVFAHDVLPAYGFPLSRTMRHPPPCCSTTVWQVSHAIAPARITTRRPQQWILPTCSG